MLTVQDIHGRPIAFRFDLFDDDWPLILGLDVKRYTKTEFMVDPPLITIRRPSDTSSRVLPIYLRRLSDLKLRALVDVVLDP